MGELGLLGLGGGGGGSLKKHIKNWQHHLKVYFLPSGTGYTWFFKNKS